MEGVIRHGPTAILILSHRDRGMTNVRVAITLLHHHGIINKENRIISILLLLHNLSVITTAAVVVVAMKIVVRVLKSFTSLP